MYSLALLLLVRLVLLELSEELLFLECNAFSLELHLLQLFAVLTAKVGVLLLSVLELLSLHLELFVDGHDGLEVPLEPLQITNQHFVLLRELFVLAFKLLYFELEVLLDFCHLADIMVQCVELVVLSKLKVVAEVLVEVVLTLGDVELLA